MLARVTHKLQLLFVLLELALLLALIIFDLIAYLADTKGLKAWFFEIGLTVLTDICAFVF